MKAYSIGREANCDIVIYDSTDVVSRRHAVLNVYPNGKMFIVDQSRNGTYVNGIRVTPNVPVPVTRKDIVSFAHVVKLDWNQVPAANLWMQVVAWVVGILLLIGIGLGAYHVYERSAKNKQPEKVEAVALEDSIRKAIEDSVAREKFKADSIAKVQADSIANEQKKKEVNEKKKAEEKKKKEEENKKKEKKDSTTNRSIG